ncbi:uncharacterized protein LOC118195452 [Stegodyphus dumicola]|uniref:uncharacterized protein LOC118195452 n=1 Tax=Stegodyphus dumicola TaxID=202533 RepID=UPI0015B16A9A|nr:uncharacterized protein LOC118195452 [Stegodyphus dumicola]
MNFYKSSEKMRLTSFIFLSVFMFHLCSAAPIDNGFDSSQVTVNYLPWYMVVISTAALLLFIYFVIGCVCCPNKSIKALSYQNGFPVSRLNDSSSLQFENPTEFAIFPPHSAVIDLQPISSAFPVFEEKVTFEPLPDILPRNVTSGQSPACSSRPAHFSALLKNKVSLHDWFDDPNSNFPRQQLQYLKELGCGWFGRVVEGEASQICNNEEKTSVVVKILREEASPSEHLHFLHEVRPYRDLMHPNVVRLLGRCLESDPFLLVLEHTVNDLKAYLKEQEHKDSLLNNGLLLQMSCNIASGLRYLHENGFTHVDLAAHNCFVCPDLSVKIGDYGISFSRHREDYYCLGDIALPIRWYAPEILLCTDSTIETKEITKEANAWAFGVVLWEIFEFAKLPYEELSNEDVLQKVLVERSVQLSCPAFDFPLSKELSLVMKECWKPVNLRPSMDKIEKFLTHLYNDRHNLKMMDSSFEERWNSLQPKYIERNFPVVEPITLKFENDFSEKFDIQNYSSDGETFSSLEMSYDMLSKNNLNNCLSPSLRVLNGSIDELTENDISSNNISFGHEKLATDTASLTSDKDNLEQENNNLELDDIITPEDISAAIRDLDLVLANQGSDASRQSTLQKLQKINHDKNNVSVLAEKHSHCSFVSEVATESSSDDYQLNGNDVNYECQERESTDFMVYNSRNNKFNLEINNIKQSSNNSTVPLVTDVNSNKVDRTYETSKESEVLKENWICNSEHVSKLSGIVKTGPDFQHADKNKLNEFEHKIILETFEDDTNDIKQINLGKNQTPPLVPDIIVHESPLMPEISSDENKSDEDSENVFYSPDCHKSFRFIFKEADDVSNKKCNQNDTFTNGAKCHDIHDDLADILKNSGRTHPLTSTPIKSWESNNVDNSLKSSSFSPEDSENGFSGEIAKDSENSVKDGSEISLSEKNVMQSSINGNISVQGHIFGLKNEDLTDQNFFTAALSSVCDYNTDGNLRFSCSKKNNSTEENYVEQIGNFALKSCEEVERNEHKGDNLNHIQVTSSHRDTVIKESRGMSNEKFSLSNQNMAISTNDTRMFHDNVYKSADCENHKYVAKSEILPILSFEMESGNLGSSDYFSTRNNSFSDENKSFENDDNANLTSEACGVYQYDLKTYSSLEAVPDSDMSKKSESHMKENSNVLLAKVLETSFPDTTSDSFIYESASADGSDNLRNDKLSSDISISSSADEGSSGDHELSEEKQSAKTKNQNVNELDSPIRMYNEVIMEDLETGEQTVITESFSGCDDYENSAESDEILKINIETDEAIIVDSSEALVGFVPSRSIELLQEYEVIPNLNHSFHVDDEKESSDSNLDGYNSASSSPAVGKYPTSPSDSPESAYPSFQPYRNFCLQNEIIEEELTDEIASPSSIHSSASLSSNEIFIDGEERMSQSSESCPQEENCETSIMPAMDHLYTDSDDGSKTDISNSSCSNYEVKSQEDNDNFNNFKNGILSDDEDVMHSFQPSQSIRWHSDETLDIERNNQSPVIIEGKEILAGESTETYGVSMENITSVLNHLSQEDRLNGLTLNHLNISQSPSPYSSVESSPCRDTVYTPDFESDSEETASGTSCSSTSGSFECIHNKFKNVVDISKVADESETSNSSREQSPMKVFSKTWDCHATPTKGVLVTPEKKFNSLRKSVSFHEESPQVVFEYPPASDSSEDGYPIEEAAEEFLWNIDYQKYADWDLHVGENEDMNEIVEIEELESEPYVRRPTYTSSSVGPLNRPLLYSLTSGFSDEEFDPLEYSSFSEFKAPSNSPEEEKYSPVSEDQISELIRNQLNNLAQEENRLKLMQNVLDKQSYEYLPSKLEVNSSVSVQKYDETVTPKEENATTVEDVIIEELLPDSEVQHENVTVHECAAFTMYSEEMSVTDKSIPGNGNEEIIIEELVESERVEDVSCSTNLTDQLVIKCNEKPKLDSDKEKYISLSYSVHNDIDSQAASVEKRELKNSFDNSFNDLSNLNEKPVSDLCFDTIRSSDDKKLEEKMFIQYENLNGVLNEGLHNDETTITKESPDKNFVKGEAYENSIKKPLDDLTHNFNEFSPKNSASTSKDRSFEPDATCINNTNKYEDKMNASNGIVSEGSVHNKPLSGILIEEQEKTNGELNLTANCKDETKDDSKNHSNYEEALSSFELPQIHHKADVKEQTESLIITDDGKTIKDIQSSECSHSHENNIELLSTKKIIDDFYSDRVHTNNASDLQKESQINTATVLNMETESTRERVFENRKELDVESNFSETKGGSDISSYLNNECTLNQYHNSFKMSNEIVNDCVSINEVLVNNSLADNKSGNSQSNSTENMVDAIAQSCNEGSERGAGEHFFVIEENEDTINQNFPLVPKRTTDDKDIVVTAHSAAVVPRIIITPASESEDELDDFLNGQFFNASPAEDFSVTSEYTVRPFEDVFGSYSIPGKSSGYIEAYNFEFDNGDFFDEFLDDYPDSLYTRSEELSSECKERRQRSPSLPSMIEKLSDDEINSESDSSPLYYDSKNITHL